MQAEMSLPTNEAPVAALRGSKAYRTYVLFALSVVGFLCAVDKIVITMFMEPMKKEFGLTDTQLGLLTGVAFSVLGGLAAIPLARWADRGSRKWIINASLLAWTVMTAASGMAVNFTQLLIARIGVGIGEAGCIPATHSMLGDYYPRGERARALGIQSGVFFLGSLGGLVGGGVLVQTVGWRYGFMILGVIGLVVSLIFQLTVREPTRVDEQAVPAAAGESVWSQLGDRRAFCYLVGAFATTSLAGSSVGTWLPSYYERAFALTPMQIGLGLGLCLGLATTIGAVVGGQLAARFGAGSKSWGAGFSAVDTVLVMPFYLASFHAPNPVLSFALLFCAFLLAGGILGPVFSTLQDLVKPSVRATAVAIVSVAGVILGQGCGPLVVGAISDVIGTSGNGAEGLRWAMTALALVNWLTVVWFWLLRQRIKAIESASCP
ncbi:MFS transporter [Pelomonas aquatica]|jgi:MFS family permease|uniref:MFS transporter n=2 Tax=Pelomonas aquatica TaxID=431058 RepID=A0A9X4LLT0_9BURK|nr:MFS transporter [Pelomonas aquatica]